VKRTLRGATILLATIGVFAATSWQAASASTGTVGEHWAPEASCDVTVDPAVLVHAPSIESSYVNYPANVFIVGPNHVQWVGYRAWLLRWNPTTQSWSYTDQNRDGYNDRGALLKAQVGNDGQVPAPSQWFNTTTQQWQNGATRLPVRYAGYYRVRVEYFWYADKYSGSGSDVLDSQNHYVASGMLVTAQPWCKY